MVKVLLVYEDFNEMTLTESYLKKVGFDVIGISNEARIQDQILHFNPDILIAYGKNLKVSSFSIGQKLKENSRFFGKVIIVVNKGIRPSPDEMLKMKMDAMMESPVDPEKLIQVLCRLSGAPMEIVLEKFKKAKLSDPELKKLAVIHGNHAEPDKVAGSSSPAVEGLKVPFEDKARRAKYEELTRDVHIDTHQTSHHRTELKEAQKDLKKGWDFEQLEELDDLKRKFAEALFKKE